MPLIFVSHAAADRVVARQFHDDIKRDFLGLCDVFVSSNLDSLHAGAEWNQRIKEKLQEAHILVGLLSPVAITRGWVFTEFGAGWIRNIPTIPVCHSGLERGGLPPPISTFQGLNLVDEEHLSHLYDLIASAVGCRKPDVVFSQRVSVFRDITEVLRLSNLIKSWSKQLFEWNPTLLSSLTSNKSEEDVLVPANLDQAFWEFSGEVNRREYLIIARRGFGIGTRVGPQASIFSVSPGRLFQDYLAQL